MKGRRILVVEDEDEVRDFILDALRRDGHEVDVADDGLKALWHVSQHAYDLILTDLKMPVMDGQAFYHEVERIRPDTMPRIIFVTGEADSPGYASFLQSVGGIALTKPFTVEALHEVVNWALGTPMS